MNKYHVIKRPVITEKSTVLKETGNYVVFEVDKRATKTQIKKAVEELFNVKVLSVKTMIVPGKVKRLGRSVGRVPSWKKAIVKLREGDRIEFFEGV
ncbi:MAG: 50S ribosomal protein L23 [Deltaproteobacteria bacterium]|nr:MAG: 50S ribosomal protein L23 [Deltaproteobacteria bacterium]